MKVRNYQADAAKLLSNEIQKGGAVTVGMPLGYGRTIIIVEAARLTEKPVAYVSSIRELRQQMAQMCVRMGVTNLACVRPSDDLSGFFSVVMSEEFKHFAVNHPRVIWQGAEMA